MFSGSVTYYLCFFLPRMTFAMEWMLLKGREPGWHMVSSRVARAGVFKRTIQGPESTLTVKSKEINGCDLRRIV